jgi:hypothetical protein
VELLFLRNDQDQSDPYESKALPGGRATLTLSRPECSLYDGKFRTGQGLTARRGAIPPVGPDAEHVCSPSKRGPPVSIQPAQKLTLFRNL